MLPTNKEKIKCATARLGSDIATLGDSIKIPLNIFEFNNSDFSLSSDGGIICPVDGEISITVSAMLSPREGYSGIKVTKNSTYIRDVYEPAGSQTYGVIGTANILTTVSAGDIIHMYVNSNSDGDIVKGSTRTQMTIIYIN